MLLTRQTHNIGNSRLCVSHFEQELCIKMYEQVHILNLDTSS